MVERSGCGSSWAIAVADKRGGTEERDAVDFAALEFSGCFLVQPNIFQDPRGTFVKFYEETRFSAEGLCATYVEDFFTTSRKDVLRGLHFQAPPCALHKLVTCVAGEILDALVDVRRTSVTYGRHLVLTLRGTEPQTLLLPPGIAHGFLVLSREAIVHYKTSSPHSSEHDTGIRWDTVGICWPVSRPIVSNRDRNFPSFSEFVSPFE